MTTIQDQDDAIKWLQGQADDYTDYDRRQLFKDLIEVIEHMEEERKDMEEACDSYRDDLSRINSITVAAL